MEINRLFGINENLSESFTSVESGVVLDDMGVGIRTGTPCLILATESKRDFKGRKYPTNRVALFPTPYQPGASPRHVFDINPGNGGPIVKSQGPSDILDTIKSVEIEQLDFTKLDKLIDRVQTRGPVSLIITDNIEGKLATNLVTLCTEIIKKFKYTSILSHYRPGTRSLVMNDRIVCAVTFSDIKNGFPVFDPEKSAGITMNLVILYTEQSNRSKSIISALEMSVAFSSFKENFTIINGQPTGVSLTTLSKLGNKIRGDSTYTAVGKIRLKNKKEEKQEGREKKDKKNKKTIT